MRLRLAILVSVAFQLSLWGQVGSSEAPVPSDPLELVTGSAQPVMDAAARAALVNLIVRAHALSNVRSSPYHMKSSFLSTTDGAWQLEDEWMGRGLYRWTAQGPSYSGVNLNANQMHYSSQPGVAIPLRLAQVRGALFFMNNTIPGPRASLRTADANLDGTAITCVLMERGFMGTPVAGGRRWMEQEFCLDPKTGLIMTYSPVPGLYIRYDYSGAIHFHDRTLPATFTITEAGQPVIEAKIESVTDPVPGDNALFQPNGLTEVGAGPPMMAPRYVRMGMGMRGQMQASGAVALHGMMSAAGKLSDLEVLASSDPNLNQPALARVANLQMWANQVQAGATPESCEVYFTMESQNFRTGVQ
ncbi:MAG TPA: hypothetical protein VHZ07_17355 [Bryobacteraceae bacterium]|jgi:hypothetical protein|nr:hypothetical protein [Bryobacteraceae bacterium]